jgi:hypothetical protein
VMYAKIPRLAASRMNASSSTSKNANRARRLRDGPDDEFERVFGALADDHNRGVLLRPSRQPSPAG